MTPPIMSTGFRRPVGANADVSELEYVAALHQTCQPNVRADGSIRADDIVHFLSSRYGIRVTVEEVRGTILKGLGGGNDEEDCIDLTEIVAALLIPFLLKAASQELSAGGESEIVGAVLRMIVLDATRGDATGDSRVKLDKAFIEKIFEAYGESALIGDDELIEDMIRAASGGDGPDAEEGSVSVSVLDRKAFARALTSDVRKYDVEWENKVTTHYYDVFGTYFSAKIAEDVQEWTGERAGLLSATKAEGQAYNSVSNDAGRVDLEEPRPRNPDGDEVVAPVERVDTFPAIDYVAGTYRSKVFVVLLWFTAVLSYFSYSYGRDVDFGHLDCEKRQLTRFGCKVANGVIDWTVIFLELSILGTSFIGLGSSGNSIYSESFLAIIVGMSVIFLFTVVPFCYEFSTEFYDTRKTGTYTRCYFFAFVGGLLLLSMQAFHLLRLCIPKDTMDRNKRLGRFFAPGLTVYESRIKRAASFKTNILVSNAFKLHQQSDQALGPVKRKSTCGRALLSFRKLGQEYEYAGGPLWVWSRVWSGRLFTEEGVWLPSRILAGNLSQVFVCISVVIGGINLGRIASEQCEQLEPYDTMEILPDSWMVYLAITLGTILGFLATAVLAISYIPSTVSTTLQFRSGVLGSLQDQSGLFAKYRSSANDRVTLLFGTMFWGAFFTALAVFILVNICVLLLLWQITRQAVLTLLAQITGLAVTVIAQTIVMSLLRKTYYVTFYRKKPAEANLAGLVFECWNVALTAGYMLARASMFLVAMALYIGRVDVPFLSTAVNKAGPLDLDPYPMVYRKDLLMHEAHRHPYLERLGVIYMMKLRHRHNFARTSGSCWRMLFVFALVPWLRKYRVEARLRLLEDDVDPSLLKFGGQKSLGRKPARSRDLEQIDNYTE